MQILKNFNHALILKGMIIFILPYFLSVGCYNAGIEKRTPAEKEGSAYLDEIAKKWTPSVWKAFVKNGPTGIHLPDFSRAGYRMGEKPIPEIENPVFDVTNVRFGAVPDDDKEDTLAIQAAIDAAATVGGGVVFLPKGRYDIHQTKASPYLQIRSDRIVLRGQGSGKIGTTLFMGAPGKEGLVRRLGTVSAEIEARHHTALAVIGAEERNELAAFTQNVIRGQTDIPVTDTGKFSEGQIVTIVCSDPLIDPTHPAPNKADIPVQLTTPFTFSPVQKDTFGPAVQTLSWIAGIEKIIDAHTIRLTRPARFDQPLRYTPKIFSFNGICEIGIEHLRIESAWPGGYRHHKPFQAADEKIIRTAREQDYLWGGIWISSAVNGWVQDVTFADMTQGIILSQSAQWTLKDLTFIGQEGHAGVTIGWGNDNLIKNVEFHARLVHPVTLTMTASGNVITDCTAHYEGRNMHSGTDTAMDFHGIFPFENLFEKMKGFYVCPGGDLSVLPHAGVRNVFWNIEAPARITGYGEYAKDSFVQTYDFVSTSSKKPATMYEHYPQAFYIGIYRRGNRSITLAGSTEDRHTRWMTVEGLNRPGIAVPSLYELQKKELR
ncbi:virulence factor [Desulfobacter hydrogenophilus]|uniref:Right-handed parallel beta-helix repeat-containing protein n=1 Tax=Desulfobacter hydrogenophilus TaxID=2291 RepID=A0A328FHQ4_9BACT|nr:right-handed parallel beta-helix repeat-containing protein [Desulfobacter hydrogenophilus]NDY71510.1 right-handed parallel beta-helix repeat-containing protein [Desulfobacter hydrogenophilus]QBH11894.1 right-handed parallel beta-helix repeat-containing protein [Desulfobacter hydrogenophilus]RAM02537.1 virulence factor [Desulfobacter hydrogenophilus]